MSDNNRSLWAWDGKAVGLRVKEERERRGIGVRELARMTNGQVSYAYVSHLEMGKYVRPSKEKLIAIFEALGIPLQEERAGPDEPAVYVAPDATLENINANLLTIRELDPEGIQTADAVIAAMLAELRRRRKARGDGEETT